MKIGSSLPPEERRRLVAFGVHAGKSNRAIARELEVDEGTVRRDRKHLATPGHDRQVKKERPKQPRTPKPMYMVDDRASVIRHKGRVLRAVKHWIEDRGKVPLTDLLRSEHSNEASERISTANAFGYKQKDLRFLADGWR